MCVWLTLLCVRWRVRCVRCVCAVVNAGTGKYLDPVVDAERVLENYFTEMLVRREKEGKQNERKSQLSYAIQRCIDTDDIAIFVGYPTPKT